jgi:hypothetical protein
MNGNMFFMTHLPPGVDGKETIDFSSPWFISNPLISKHIYLEAANYPWGMLNFLSIIYYAKC